MKTLPLILNLISLLPLITTLVDEPGYCVTKFQYVIERQEQARICFLSGQQRGLDVLKKSTSLAKPYNLEMTSALYKTMNKVRSTRGVGGLAELGPRFEKMHLEQRPGPCRYDVLVRKPFKPSVRSFGSAPRICRIISSTPGPGTYESVTKCRCTKMCHTFGGRVRMHPAIDAECIAKPIDKCDKCNITCVGDYWHLRGMNFLCIKCMRFERLNKNTQFSIKEYRRLRNCSYMHRHEGTTAAVRLLNNKEIFTKARKENYLDLYFNKF